jgi:hypothetical protein
MTSESPDIPALPSRRAFNQRLITAFEQMNIPYGIGGSIAAMSYSKTSRFTNDVDVMFDADVEKLSLFVKEVERWQVYIDPIESIFEYNLPAHLPINILDGLAGAKADLFLVQHDGLDASIMRRLQRRKLYVQPDFFAWFLSPEDVILYKLLYYKQSEGASQKHPADIHAILRALETEIDREYLEHWAHEIGVLTLWQVVWDEFHQA